MEIFRSLLTQLFELLSEPTEVEARARSFAVGTPPLFPLSSLHLLLLDQHSLLLYVTFSDLRAAVFIDVVKRLRQSIELVNEFRVDGEVVELNFGGHERQRRLSFLLVFTLCRFSGFADLQVAVRFQFVDVGKTVTFAAKF